MGGEGLAVWVTVKLHRLQCPGEFCYSRPQEGGNQDGCLFSWVPPCEFASHSPVSHSKPTLQVSLLPSSSHASHASDLGMVPAQLLLAPGS